MHREITYRLENLDNIDETIKAFIHTFLDLDCNYPDYELTDEIKKKFYQKVKEGNLFNFLTWITYQLEFMQISWEVKFKFFQRFLEILQEGEEYEKSLSST